MMTPDKMQLRIYPDPVLLQPGEAVAVFDELLSQNVERMFEIMAESRGIGLAAHQIGWPVRLFVMTIPREEEQEDEGGEEEVSKHDLPKIPERYVIINPKIIAFGSEEIPYLEGCLSFPDIRATVYRPDRVIIEYQDLQGNTRKLEAEGLTSRCIQHEYDHIEGKLFNRLWTPATRVKHGGKIKQLKSEFDPDKLPEI